MAACDLILELLEATLHSVLYLRNLYPAAIFRKRQKYKVPVHMSLHKEVNEYMASSLRALRPYLERQLLEELAVVVLDSAGRVAETVSVQVAVLDPAAFTLEDDTYLAQLETTLAGLLLTLYSTLPGCPPPPPDATFRLHATVTHCLADPLESTGGFQMTLADQPRVDAACCRVVPIRSVRNSMFSVEMSLRRPPTP